MLKREVETFANLSHPNIVEFKSAQGRDGPNLEIFTALKEGNIEDLMKNELFIKGPELPSTLLHQMLKALDYLAFKGIVHRDVKPANILYQTLPNGGYTFQLTDFGLCNAIVDAQMQAGSPIFMAPELFVGGQQTSKVDVWSLYITIIVDPEARASAADMLDKLFNGQGRSTPVGQVQGAPSVNKNLAVPRKEQDRNHKIVKKAAPKQRHSGQMFESLMPSDKRGAGPPAFQGNIVNSFTMQD